METKMKLVDLLEEMEYECVQGSVDRDISTLVYDSRKVERDSVFVCITGQCGMPMILPGKWRRRGRRC